MRASGSFATWHAHRAISYAAKKEFDAAKDELRAYRRVLENIQPEHLGNSYSVKAARGRLKVIDHFVPGEIALQQGKLRKAIRHLEKAKVAEERVRAGASTANEKIERAQQETKEAVDRSINRLESFVREKPVTAAGVAFAAGIVAASLLLRR